VVEEQMEAARRRWGVEILHYPGPLLVETLKAGQFCEDSYKAAGLPDWSREDIMRLARGETGIRLVVSGAKFSDGLGQGLKHRQLAKRRAEEGREGDELLPLAKWNKWDVLAYLKANKIPTPESDGRNSSSIDCSTACLLWLHDRHPDDFELVCKVFRYARAVVYRRRWHGVK
jgi:3'-phosphoadenosine 5'-phosphosulfate sulfotransferase (PAPS reductase)/FAD synthetase